MFLKNVDDITCEIVDHRHCVLAQDQALISANDLLLIIINNYLLLIIYKNNNNYNYY